MRLATPTACVLLACFLPAAPAQDTSEVKALKEKIEAMEKKLQLAEKQNADVRKELDQVKGSKGGAAKSLSARLEVGTVLTGTEDFAAGVRGSLILEVTERSGTKIKAAYTFRGKDTQGKPVRAERDLEGDVSLNLVTFKSVGKASVINLSLTMNGGALSGGVKHSDLGNGKVGLKFGR